MLARGMEPKEFLLSFFAKDGSFSRGRQMHALVSCAGHNILSIATPVGNGALQSAGIAAAVKEGLGRPIVLCSLGDGTTQQGEVLEAIGHAVRDALPVLFLIEDNSLAISTRTRGRTFFSLPGGRADSFYGLPILYADGRRAEELYGIFGREVAAMRVDRRPRIVVMEVERLGSHSNADDQRVYRPEEELASLSRSGDPVRNLREVLVARGEKPDDLDRMEAEIRADLEEKAREAQRGPNPKPVFEASLPFRPEMLDPAKENRGGNLSGGGASGKDPSAGSPGLTMLEAIRETLRERLEKDPRVNLFGQDIEDPKGDVFGVTRGLSTRFPGRVVNSPLAESTILGVSIGRALAGERPVAFLQFADFMPMAYNQIFSELATLYWRTDGSWQAPVIVMAVCGGYRPGLGPFHASSMEALAAHTPGLDVYLPSTAADAAGLLRAAFESGRPSIFLYPKTLLNDRENAVTGDADALYVPPGKARFLRRGNHLTFVGYGNTVGLCLRAAAALSEHEVACDVIDLRSIMPWDRDAVLESAERTGRLVVVHEDSLTCGMGAEIAATVAEKVSGKVEIRRVARPDTWVPYNFENQIEVLPSFKRTLETAAELLGGNVTWKGAGGAAKGVHVVEAAGSSPADESVTVISWKVSPGDKVESGTLLAEIEADKAAAELNSPVSGTVETLLVEAGIIVKVGTPVLKIRTVGAGEDPAPIMVTREDPGTPVISGLGSIGSFSAAGASERPIGGAVDMGILGIAGAVGSRRVTNGEISRMCPTWSPEDIVKRTGIESRPWIGEGESALTLAVDACTKLFARTGNNPLDIDLILCSTGTPVYNTPAMATLIHNKLAGGDETFMAQAYDISAACSGYLYGLQIAYDYLGSVPGARILLVTTEVLSPRTNTADPVTAPIFADAATATLLAGGNNLGGVKNRVRRPVLSAKGESGDYLRVPSGTEDKIFMEGQKVYVEAVRGMMMMLNAACVEAGTKPEKLDLIIPHQANQRIINAIRQKLKMPEERMFSNIRNMGNSSSSTIPLCLQTVLGFGGNGAGTAEAGTKGDPGAGAKVGPGGRIGLTAFGGGFTFGGAVLDLL
jgi:2-oxoisovalerate dehydrogenase E1 component